MLSGWNKVELFAIPPTCRDELYAWRFGWRELVDACRTLSVPTLSSLAYNKSLVISDHVWAAVLQVPALEIDKWLLLGLFVVKKRGSVRYDCFDPCMDHGGCGAINLVLSSGQRQVDHYGFAQIVARCLFYPDAAYLVYQLSAEIDWSYLCLSNCWLLYQINDGRFHQLLAPELTSIK